MTPLIVPNSYRTTLKMISISPLFSKKDHLVRCKKLPVQHIVL